jgi:hypothetical protein
MASQGTPGEGGSPGPRFRPGARFPGIPEGNRHRIAMIRREDGIPALPLFPLPSLLTHEPPLSALTPAAPSPAQSYEDAKILPADGHAGQEFGSAAALHGGILAVGSRGDDDRGTDSGSAYLFDAASGAQRAKLTAHAGAASLTTNVPSGAAGRVNVQAVDAASDRTSNVVGL